MFWTAPTRTRSPKRRQHNNCQLYLYNEVGNSINGRPNTCRSRNMLDSTSCSEQIQSRHRNLSPGTMISADPNRRTHPSAKAAHRQAARRPRTWMTTEGLPDRRLRPTRLSAPVSGTRQTAAADPAAWRPGHIAAMAVHEVPRDESKDRVVGHRRVGGTQVRARRRRACQPFVHRLLSKRKSRREWARRLSPERKR
jgi:hypothetical protein